MDKDFEKALVLQTLNLQREYAQLGSEPIDALTLDKVKSEISDFMKTLLEFIEPQTNRPDRNPLEPVTSGLTKLLTITDTVLDSYETHYIQEGRSKLRHSFEGCEKPQLLFKDRLDNSEKPFVPKLKEKHNQLSKLDSYFVEYQKAEEIPPDYKFGHPYQHELEELQMNYGLLLKVFSSPSTQVDFASTRFSYIESVEDIHSLAEHLCTLNNFSFDVHNHSYRSYLGFICSIEISTDTADYVIDGLKLREHIHLLNKPFTSPKILKIAMDTQQKLLWLQRDFGIYVVNLLDLKLVVDRLSLPNSLPFLVNKFLDFSFKDIYAEFDFRKRPLTGREKLFLRSFSHLVLRLFFVMKEVIPKFGFDDFFEEVFEESKKFCLEVYEKPTIDEAYSRIFTDTHFNFNINRVNKLKKLISWRDYTARLEDESREYIFSNELIEAVLHETPKDIEELKSLMKNYPREVSMKHVDTIFSIVEEKDLFQENKDMSKFELNENSTEILQSLFTPTRSFMKAINGHALDQESPAYEQTELHRLIHWSSGKKDIGEQFETPRKLFDDFLSKGVLTPSGIRDSPSENLNEDLTHIRNIISNRNDSNYVKREVQKIPLMRGGASSLNEIKEEDAAVDALDFATIKENLPQNIGEIYELGNNIRKRNKNKKKKELKQPNSQNEFPSLLDYSQASSQQGDSSYRMSIGTEKGGKSAREDTGTTDSILRDLGWI